jgi:4-amino-4-deoxy-L-arabinose transferase-like glycosyltransferase
MTRTLLREHWRLLAVLIAFLFLGGVYSTITPIFEAPDEIQHFFHVKHIADGKGLPVLGAEEGARYEQEGGQPSLYYLLGAFTTFWIDTSNAEGLLDHNPYVNLGVPAVEGNKNVLLHTSQEGFPYHGAVLAVHLLRFLSLLFGGVTVLATYVLAMEVFPGQRALALGAAVLTALNPQFIFTNASVNNDGLLFALCSVALLYAVLIVSRGPSRLRFAALGVSIGLASLTKLTGVGLLAPAFVALVIVGVRYSPRAALKGAAWVVGLTALLAGWWYLRNWFLYQDFTGMSKFFEALGGSPGRNLTLGQFLTELEGFRLSYWAVFGWFNVLAGRWVYRFFDLLVLLGAIGLPLGLARALKRREAIRFAPVVVLLVWLGTVTAGYVRYNQLIDAATGRLVFPAIGVISALLTWGLVQFPPRQQRLSLVYGVGAATFLVALACTFLYIRPAYARPPLLPPQEAGSIADQLDVSYGGRLRLLGYDLEKVRYHPADYVYVTLYWEGLAQMDEDYSVSLVLLTPSGDLVGQEDSYPGLGSYPTSQWMVGEIVADRRWVRIRPRAQVPTTAWLGVSVYYLPTMEGLPVSEEVGAGQQALLEQVAISSGDAEEYSISHPASWNFGDQIDLIGYDLNGTELGSGDSLELILYWRARGEPDADYTVFTHLVDGAGHIWAQDDGYPLGGDYPTSFWETGEVVADRYELILDPGAPEGGYQLEVGLYLLPSLERLPVLDDEGLVLDNRIVVSKINVVGSR